MIVDKEFFEGEEREGFYIEAKMKRFWAAEIEVLEEIKRICQNNGIRYFAEWGTLLGAVRHNGFIPWDDDLDIGMLRDDWIRFMEIAPRELGPEFEVRNLYCDREHDQVIARVINGRYMNFDEGHLARFHACPFSAGIDVFPIDYLPRDVKKREEQDKLFRFLMKCASSLSAEPPYNEDDYEIVNRLQAMTGFQVNWDNRLYHELKKMVDEVCSYYQDEEADTVCGFMRRYWQPTYEIPKQWYQEVMEVPFEYTTIAIPIGYEGILRRKYGDDYMTPRNVGGGHSYPIYREQELALKEVMEQEFHVTMTLEDIQKIIDMKVFGEE